MPLRGSEGTEADTDDCSLRKPQKQRRTPARGRDTHRALFQASITLLLRPCLLGMPSKCPSPLHFTWTACNNPLPVSWSSVPSRGPGTGLEDSPVLLAMPRVCLLIFLPLGKPRRSFKRIASLFSPASQILPRAPPPALDLLFTCSSSKDAGCLLSHPSQLSVSSTVIFQPSVPRWVRQR